MRKLISVSIVSILALTLAGCGKISRITANFTGYDTVCVAGVQYIQFSSGATVQVDQTGKPISCVK